MTENRFRTWYRSKPGRPLVLAHRGDSSHAPENTIEAAKLGLDSGADGWEFDVRVTKDGVPIVFHDVSLARTTDVALRFAGDSRQTQGFLLADFLWEEVRSLDAGSWFVDAEGGPRSAVEFGTLGRLAEFDRVLFCSGRIGVPTLAEALGVTARLDRLANLEIKPVGGDLDALVNDVLRHISDASMTSRSAVSSFDHEVVRRVASREPGVATGALVEGPPEIPAAALLRSLGADALHAPASAVGAATNGVALLVYTVNDARPGGLAERLGEAGVVGLFTDDPAALSIKYGISPSSKRTRPH